MYIRYPQLQGFLKNRNKSSEKKFQKIPFSVIEIFIINQYVAWANISQIPSFCCKTAVLNLV